MGEIPVDCRNETGKGIGCEDSRPNRTVVGFRELVPEGKHDRGGTEGDRKAGVEYLTVEGTVEPIVETWHDRAGNQQGDAAVVESEKKGVSGKETVLERQSASLLGKEDANVMRMAREGVVAGGKTETEDGGGEEYSQHDFIDEGHCGVGRADKEIDTEHDETDAADAVCPDV